MTRRDEVARLPCPGGGEVDAHLSYADRPANRAVVYVHGLGSVRGGEKSRALEAACARRGWTFAACDFRGHGGSTGTLLDLRGSALLKDLDTFRDYLAGRGVSRLCLVGSSMGGWAAAWWTVLRPEVVDACALIAPAFRFPTGLWSRLGPAERERWRQTGRLRLRNDWMDAEIGYGLMEEQELFPFEHLAAVWRKPLLIFHGLADDVVPCEGSLEFVRRTAAADVELRVYKAGDHRLSALKEGVAEAACDFFARRT